MWIKFHLLLNYWFLNKISNTTLLTLFVSINKTFYTLKPGRLEYICIHLYVPYIHILLSDTTQTPQNPFIQLKFYNILLALIRSVILLCMHKHLKNFCSKHIEYNSSLQFFSFLFSWNICVYVQVLCYTKI